MLDASDLNAWDATLMAVYVHRLAAAVLFQDVVRRMRMCWWALHHFSGPPRLRGGISDEGVEIIHTIG